MHSRILLQLFGDLEKETEEEEDGEEEKQNQNNTDDDCSQHYDVLADAEEDLPLKTQPYRADRPFPLGLIVPVAVDAALDGAGLNLPLDSCSKRTQQYHAGIMVGISLWLATTQGSSCQQQSPSKCACKCVPFTD